ASRQGLSPSRRKSRRPLGARDASQAGARVDAGRARSVQAIEALCRLWTQGSTRIELGALRPCTSLLLPMTALIQVIALGGIRTAAGAALNRSTPQATVAAFAETIRLAS